jgi:hypothetical protein
MMLREMPYGPSVKSLVHPTSDCKEAKMRSSMVVICEMLVFLCACSAPSDEQVSAAARLTWTTAFWEETMFAIKSAQGRGDRNQVESLCAQAIPYVERQAIKALNDYAALLDSQHTGSGSDMRAKAERLAQAKAQQARATKPGNTYLGFVPWEELARYADALHAVQRESDSQAMRSLAAAYKYSQEVYVRRTVLMYEGKDPRGEC